MDGSPMYVEPSRMHFGLFKNFELFLSLENEVKTAWSPCDFEVSYSVLTIYSMSQLPLPKKVENIEKCL